VPQRDAECVRKLAFQSLRIVNVFYFTIVFFFRYNFSGIDEWKRFVFKDNVLCLKKRKHSCEKKMFNTYFNGFL